MTRLIRRLSILLLLLAALAAGGWWAAALGLERAARSALTTPEAQPLRAQAVETGGFPGRLALRLTAPAVQGEGWAWAAPSAELAIATLAPNRLVLTLPPQQTLDLGGAPLALRAAAMGGTLTLAPRPDLRLRSLTLGGQALQLADLAGAEVIEAALTQPADTPVAALSAVARRLTLPPAAMAALPPGLGLPAVVDSAEIEARATLSAPLDRHSGAAPITATALEIAGAALHWGAVTLRAEGGLAADTQGFAEGRVMVHVTGWRALLPLLAASGAVRPELLPTVENALTRLAVKTPEGGDGRLDLPLVFRAGRVSLGPLPLGAAPRFY